MENNYAYFMIPGFYEHFQLYITILSAIKQNPEFLRDKAKIHCFFGNFQFCTWDGGRSFGETMVPASKEKIEHVKYVYNDIFNMPVRFIFTNSMLTEEDCYDRYNNLVLDIFDNGMNEIVVNSDLLEKYLREKYPNYGYISSTTKCLTNPDDSKKELNKDYRFVCLDYNLNHNKKYLENLTNEEKEKTEFLVNAICGPACPNRKEHYRQTSICALHYGKPYILRNCKIDKNLFYPEPTWNTRIEPNELYTDYLNNGFKYFKLEGRTLNDSTALMIFTKYLIKEEYQYAFMDMILCSYQNYVIGATLK